MLLCYWAVTGNREGLHRPLIVAQILEWRQQEILKVFIGPNCCCLYYIITDDTQGTSLTNCSHHGDEGCCPEMDVTLHVTNEFPFHDILVKFLDTRAPLPSKFIKCSVTVTCACS